MFSALAYKEWLKTRWFFLGSALIGITAILTVLIKLGAYFEFNSASSFWSYVVLKGYLYYGNFKFIPLAIALIIAGAQFVPEFVNYRLKLTLHLPLKETTLFFYMVSFGTLLLFVLDVVFMLLLVIISNIYFPAEIVESMIITILPWMLAGFSAYFFAASLLIEPLWGRRVIIAVFGYGYVTNLLLSVKYMAYIHALGYLAILTATQFALIFLSGFRFKRGAR